MAGFLPPSYTWAGLLGIALACLCLYAASPNQRCWAKPWPKTPACGLGALLLALSLAALMQEMQRLTAVFVWMTAVMLGLVLLPYLGAWRYARRRS